MCSLNDHLGFVAIVRLECVCVWGLVWSLGSLFVLDLRGDFGGNIFDFLRRAFGVVCRSLGAVYDIPWLFCRCSV